MVLIRTCTATKQNGERCGSAPVRDETHCFWHHPDHADAAAEARRLGGIRRKREHTVAGAYEFEGLQTVAEIRRLVEIVALDALGMENSHARGRLILAAAQVARSLLDTGELEDRLGQIEAALGPRLLKAQGRR